MLVDARGSGLSSQPVHRPVSSCGSFISSFSSTYLWRPGDRQESTLADENMNVGHKTCLCLRSAVTRARAQSDPNAWLYKRLLSTAVSVVNALILCDPHGQHRDVFGLGLTSSIDSKYIDLVCAENQSHCVIIKPASYLIWEDNNVLGTLTFNTPGLESKLLDEDALYLLLFLSRRQADRIRQQQLQEPAGRPAGHLHQVDEEETGRRQRPLRKHLDRCLTSSSCRQEADVR
ncbi:hypothetical protein EYF80_024468 [Liparis tanakae]|uniref:Uncharacterized protein n=1 Tax=Liparis tanakae TaxID=230148 RepID=A0A4Z2HK71_9TELE|nr:hypothetical protein EYF80_024468 [Liparis tanakae]